MSMPWYLTLGLFLLAPVYTILVRDKLWPKLQDSWAARSKHRLRIRISKLEARLASAELLPLHTEVEHYMFQGIHGAVLLSGLGVHITLATMFFVVGVFRSVILQAYGSDTMVKLELVFLGAVILNGLFLVGIANFLSHYWQPRSEKWRASLRDEISTLQVKLR